MDVMTNISAFLIIAAFLIGGYSMFRISEHYNKEFRRIIEERTEDRMARELFEMPLEGNTPKRRPPRPQPQRQLKKTGDDENER